MVLTLTRYLITGAKDSTTFALDKYFTLIPGNVDFRVSSVERYNQDGGEETGDGNCGPRKFTLSRQEAKTTDADYLTVLNNVINFFRAGYNSSGVEITDYYIEDSTTSRRAKVALAGIKDESDRALIRRYGMTGFDLIWLNAAWESLTESTVSNSNLATGGTVTAAVTGLPTDCRITLLPKTTTISEFTLRNAANGAAITVAAANFVVGSIVAINGTTQGGSVLLTSASGIVTDVSSAVADNTGFIPLVPGNNVITYTSAYGAVSLRMYWRNRAYF